jgi:hypothetical protein
MFTERAGASTGSSQCAATVPPQSPPRQWAPGDWQETLRLLFFADEPWNPNALPAWIHLWRLVDVVSRREIDFIPDEWTELPSLE